MGITRRTLLTTAPLLLLPARVFAKTWPAQPIRIVVPFPPGGSTDILGRTVGDYLQKTFGVPVIVENRPGATGTLGTGSVARAKPDGYTLLMGSIGTMVTNHFLYDDLSFKMSALAPVINIAETPNVVMVRNDLQLESLQDLIELMKKRPGELNHGSPGLASSSHVSAELFKVRADVKAEHIPYKGSSPMLVDLMGGSIDFTIDNISSSLELIKAGKVKALAVTSKNRSPLLPELPTMMEAGLPNFVMAPWFCIAAPEGTPQAIMETLNKALNAMLSDEAVKKTLNSYGATPAGGTSAEIQAVMQQDAELITSLSEMLNFKAS